MVRKNRQVNILKIKINFEGFSLHVVSDEPNKTLNELNVLIKSKKELVESLTLHKEDLGFYEGFEDDYENNIDMRQFTRELMSNKKFIDTIRELYLKHKHFIYRNERIDAKKEIDLTTNRFSVIIEKKDITFLIKNLLFDVNLSKLKHVLIHVISDNFSKEHQEMLLDEIKKRSSFADATFIYTPKKLNGVVVAETLFFGDYPNQIE